MEKRGRKVTHMKINWFSPLPPEKTDIGNFTARILPDLIQRADVIVWTEQEKWDYSIDKLCTVKNINDLNWADLNEQDISIFNIGNNADYHSKIWHISTQAPGIIILHDYHLQHLFGGIFRSQEDSGKYFNAMQRYYGTEGQLAARKFLSGTMSTEQISEQFPLTEYALENALGVIVHTNYAFDKIVQSNRWPIELIPLPYPSSHNQTEINTHLQSRLNTAQSQCELIVFGYLGLNRRLESILEALAELRVTHKYSLNIYGQLWNKKNIEHKIEKLNLRSQVKIHGYVTEKKLDEALSKSHLALNLRHPTMGEASGSQLRIWNHALPSLVTRTGWYAELPEDAVRFVGIDHEIEDIKSALIEFKMYPERFIEMGKKGKQYLEQWHNPDVYAQSVVTFAQQICSVPSPAVAFKLAERVADEISNWQGDDNNDFGYVKPASSIYELFKNTK